MPETAEYRVIVQRLDDDERGNPIIEFFRDTARSYRVYKAASRPARLVVGLLMISLLAGLIVVGTGGPGWLSSAFSVVFGVSLVAIIALLCAKLVRRLWRELREIVR